MQTTYIRCTLRCVQHMTCHTQVFRSPGLLYLCHGVAFTDVCASLLKCRTASQSCWKEKNVQSAQLELLGDKKGLMYANTISVQGVLGRLVPIQEKLETGRILLPEYYCLAHTHLRVMMESIGEKPSCPLEGVQRTALSMLPRVHALELSDSMTKFWTVPSGKWSSTCAETWQQLTHMEVRRQAMV